MAEKKTKTPAPMRVRATRPGFYGGNYINKGMTFTLADGRAFSERWMEPVPADTPDDLATKMGDESMTLGALQRHKAQSSASLTMEPASDTPATDDLKVI